MCLRNTWCTETQTGQARIREGAQLEHSNSLDSIPPNSGLQSVQLLAKNGPEAGSAHRQYGELWHAQGRVRRLDVKWLWTQEAVQAGRFSLKQVGTDINLSDLTTKHHDEERLRVLMDCDTPENTEMQSRWRTKARQPW